MSYELRPEKPLCKDIRRIVRKQLDDVLKQLALQDKPVLNAVAYDKAVHEVRKGFKKIRAVLRLIEPVICHKSFAAENRRCRDAARPFTELRDTRILIDTLDELAKQDQAVGNDDAFEEIRQSLESQLRDLRRDLSHGANAFSNAAEISQKLREQIKDWVDIPNKWSSLGRGFAATYRSARQTFELARDESTMESMHEWRKQTKHLHYQLEILRPLNRKRIGPLSDETRQLGELLGQIHDLAILHQTLTAHANRFENPRQIGAICGLIDSSQFVMQAEVISRGERFFQKTPAKFVGTLKAHWKDCRKLLLRAG